MGLGQVKPWASVFSPVQIGLASAVLIQGLQEADTKTELGLQEIYWGNTCAVLRKGLEEAGRASDRSAGMAPEEGEGARGMGRKRLPNSAVQS